MHTIGSTFTRPGFRAGGLRDHSTPVVSYLGQLGLIEVKAYHQTQILVAGVSPRAPGPQSPLVMAERLVEGVQAVIALIEPRTAFPSLMRGK